jgi:hypothetical protein
MTPKSAMCAFLGCDSLKDMEESHRYQPKPGERFPLYTADEWAYTYGTTKPQGEWEQDPDQFHARQAGTIIWRQRRTA